MKRLNNYTKYLLMHWWLLENCHKFAHTLFFKCLYLARIGRPDILWSVNELARAVTKWTKACDKRLNRLISYIHHTCECKQYCHVGNTAKQCRLGTVSRLWFCKRSRRLKINIQVDSCAFSGVTRLCQQVGCARNRLQFHTVLQKRK